ncbi:DHS-like NAD/FAD-binding domain-containing protein [Geopyxis carbonaria]|nr:DHS-like NAD/FAD-binding domain-containing protein [Geopyxis carbonaria]
MQRIAESTVQKIPPSPPPEKKKKAVVYLDVQAPLSDKKVYDSQKRQVDMLLKLLYTKKKIVVVAGAGISVASGVPDFRSSEGLFTTLRSAKTPGKELFDASVYKDDKLTSSFHDMVRDLHALTSKAQPTEFHHMLATLAKEGRLLRLYTQNVDCIDTRLDPLQTRVPLPAKGPWPKSVQLHGGLDYENCSKCGWIGPFEPEIFVGPEPPDCQECVEMESVRGIAGKRCLGIGKLRPRIVLYNEFNPESEPIGTITNADLKSRPDAVIVVGTSLKVPGVRRIVREMCNSVGDYRGGITVWMNAGEQPGGKEFEGLFDLVVRGDCEKVARLANMPHWDNSKPAPYKESPAVSCPQPCADECRHGSTIEVQIPQLPSPSMSPRPSNKKLVAKKRKLSDNGNAISTKRKTVLAPKSLSVASSKSSCKVTETVFKPKSKVSTKDSAKGVHSQSLTVKSAFKAVKKVVVNTSTKSSGRSNGTRKRRLEILNAGELPLTPPSYTTSPLLNTARSPRMEINSLLN